MIEIGVYNELTILRTTSVGLYLGDDEGEDVYIRDYIYAIALQRVEGILGIVRSTRPWDGSGKYDMELIWELTCKKLDKKF